ncbi:hypothetical protein D3C81_1765010 [compost metagenome]
MGFERLDAADRTEVIARQKSIRELPGKRPDEGFHRVIGAFLLKITLQNIVAALRQTVLAQGGQVTLSALDAVKHRIHAGDVRDFFMPQPD